MAKHGKKKLRFHFDDLDFASFFLNFIRRKNFYCRVTGTMKSRTGQLELSIVGSSENVRKGIQKIKHLYNKAYDQYLNDNLSIEQLEVISDEKGIEDHSFEKKSLNNSEKN